MSVHWPTAPGTPHADPEESAWLRRATVEQLRILKAINVVTYGARDLPPWAAELVAAIKAEAEAQPEQPTRPAPESGVADPLAAPDFETALAGAWTRATAAEREALATIARALGVEVPEPPEPATAEPAPVAPHSAPCAPEETPPEDTPAESSEEAPEAPSRPPRGSKPAGFSMVDDGDDEPTDPLGDWTFYVPNRRRD